MQVYHSLLQHIDIFASIDCCIICAGEKQLRKLTLTFWDSPTCVCPVSQQVTFHTDVGANLQLSGAHNLSYSGQKHETAYAECDPSKMVQYDREECDFGGKNEGPPHQLPAMGRTHERRNQHLLLRHNILHHLQKGQPNLVKGNIMELLYAAQCTIYKYWNNYDNSGDLDLSGLVWQNN